MRSAWWYSSRNRFLLSYRKDLVSPLVWLPPYTELIPTVVYSIAHVVHIQSLWNGVCPPALCGETAYSFSFIFLGWEENCLVFNLNFYFITSMFSWMSRAERYKVSKIPGTYLRVSLEFLRKEEKMSLICVPQSQNRVNELLLRPLLQCLECYKDKS